MAKKRIVITKKDIEQGIAGSALCCPVALALKRAYGQESAPRVLTTYAYIDDLGLCADLPEKAKYFIRLYDLGKYDEVKPISFSLDFKSRL